MKPTYLLGILALALIVTLPLSEAMIQLPGKLGGAVTKTIPFKYINWNGDEYTISLAGINIAGKNTTATLQFDRYDNNGNLLKATKLNLLIGQGYRMCAQVNNNGQNICPVFRLQKILPSHCLPRTNKCSEDAVMISVA
ncbi:MAG: hypothetical protein HY438_01505 [DPANN group archaeon]|nr:hypothetical protein [DPANN group archaeon]